MEAGIIPAREIEELAEEGEQVDEEACSGPASPEGSAPSSPLQDHLATVNELKPRDAECDPDVAKPTRKRDMKNGQSYIAMIARAILTSPEKKLSLHGIYEYVAKNYAQYKNKVGWRNSVRHNLSLNECFIKAGRCESGKGNYWAVHPANFDDFSRGDFRRRHARNRVRKSKMDLPNDGDVPFYPPNLRPYHSAPHPSTGCWLFSLPSSLVSPISPMPMYGSSLTAFPYMPSRLPLIISPGDHYGKFTGAGSAVERRNPQKRTFSIENLLNS
eukprot:m.311996 g.311996  ORF g.311996 m.311996 type:complete len:272 (+) comp194745_c0_seq1:33-848(+)